MLRCMARLERHDVYAACDSNKRASKPSVPSKPAAGEKRPLVFAGRSREIESKLHGSKMRVSA